ncbi:RNA-directed DNA polymerase [Tanacetum coccineum]
MQIRVQGFDSFHELYCDDPDFREIWSKCDNGPFQQFSKLNGYLFKGAQLCIPLCSLREAIVLEGHAGGLAGHFWRDKTLALLREQFYWPKMERDVNRLLERCRTCHIAKTHSSNAGLYTPLSVPVAPWEDVSLDIIGKSPFEVVYGRNPITPLDLVPVQRCSSLVRKGLTSLSKLKSCIGRFGKLKPRGDGPFRVLKMITDNAYKIELPGHYNVSATFNVADLS